MFYAKRKLVYLRKNKWNCAYFSVLHLSPVATVTSDEQRGYEAAASVTEMSGDRLTEGVNIEKNLGVEHFMKHTSEVLGDWNEVHAYRNEFRRPEGG